MKNLRGKHQRTLLSLHNGKSEGQAWTTLEACMSYSKLLFFCIMTAVVITQFHIAIVSVGAKIIGVWNRVIIVWHYNVFGHDLQD